VFSLALEELLGNEKNDDLANASLSIYIEFRFCRQRVDSEDLLPRQHPETIKTFGLK